MPLLGSRGAASTTGFGGLTKLGYLLRNSLRFRASNSAYLSRTFTTSTNNKIWTYSAWIKLSDITGNPAIMGTTDDNTASGNFGVIRFSAGQIQIVDYAGGYRMQLSTTARYRDPAAWYHVVIAVDTTQATSTNRVKLYINGTQVTAFSTSTYPSQNLNTFINSAAANYLCAYYTSGVGASSPFDGYMAEVNFIDGQQLTPSSFGKTDAGTGQWVPIKYTGTYGTNGFYLPFTNTTSTSTLGNDFSGNGNTWTVNNISLTSGSTYDSMTDVPTNTSATVANYCVLNPLNNTGTTASANLNWNGTDKAILSTIAFPTTGKYYFEATCSTVANFSIIGIANAAIYASAFNGVLASANFRTYNSGGEKADSTRTASWGSTFTNNDIIGVAVDMDNGAIYFAKNNTWQASGVPTSGASKTGAAFTDLTSSGLTWTPFFSATNINGVWIANFGQRPFSYTPPSGFKALNTFNLP